MTVTERITEDIKAALKSGERERLGVLRFLSSQLYNKAKEKQAKGEAVALNDGEAVEVLRKEVKRRREALELFRKGGREDLLKKEEAELKIIEAYLPPAVTPAEIEALIDRLTGQGFKDYQSLMKEAMKELKGRGADGHVVGELIRNKLGE